VASKPSSIVYDDTPIHVYMSRIFARVVERGQLALGDLFDRKLHKSALVGMFLAVLELVRHHKVRAEQNELFGEIWLLPSAGGAAPLDLSDIDSTAYQYAEK